MKYATPDRKTCPTCQQMKNISEFYIKNINRGTYRSACMECTKVKNREYRQRNAMRHKEYYLKRRDYILRRLNDYFKTPNGKLIKSKNHAKDKGKGFFPLNSPISGYDCHHLFINGSKDLCIFIPPEIHTSVYHHSRTGNGMNGVNKAALLWLCEQAVI